MFLAEHGLFFFGSGFPAERRQSYSVAFFKVSPR